MLWLMVPAVVVGEDNDGGGGTDTGEVFPK